MTNNTKTSSDKVATLASKVLQNPHSSKVSKTLAGSVLSQSQAGKNPKNKGI